MAEIVFVHCGVAPPPPHLRDLLLITQQVASKSSISVLANAGHAGALESWGAFFKFVPIETITASAEHRRFAQSCILNKDFRDGFWYHTSRRFFVLADYMRHGQLEDVVHFENDVVPFFDPFDKVAALRQFAQFAVPLDRTRAIASMVWFANSRVASALCKHLVDVPAINDMQGLNDFCTAHPHYARPLPTIPLNYAMAKKLDVARFCQGIDRFGGVFDAASIGQYVSGVDRRNNPHESRFFLNESSDLDMREFDFCWDADEGIRYPVLRSPQESTRVLCLHAHSKNVSGLSPLNHSLPKDSSDLITGERLQCIAHLTVSAPAITQFHGRENIKTPLLVEVGQTPQGQLLVPNEALFDTCATVDSYFVYTHLIAYFRQYIAPRLTKPFTLISHNSDHAVGAADLELLNNPLLHRWWAQNCDISHPRLSPLPKGLANSQWGAEKLAQLFSASRHTPKEKLLYANVGLTHPSRVLAMQAARLVADVTIESGVGYPQYLASIARHKFCLCPRGNGLDSHRFWEAIYLGCIPIIVIADWNPAYAELPVLMLSSWEELSAVNLHEKYVTISTTPHRFERSKLKHYQTEICQPVALHPNS